MNILKTGLLAMAAAHGALAATPQTSTMEFFHTGLQHYFVTADAIESLAVDGGAAGNGWVRTGRSFGVWTDDSAAPAGAVPVCRFYSTGAHAHFYTANAGECAQLRALQSAQSAAAAAAQQPFTGWAFEGNAFFAQVPASGQCPAATEAVYRFYNDGSAAGTGSSHRFVTDAEMSTLMQSRGWTAEGIAFCSPVTASGTSAPATPTTGAFPEIAATWTGNAKWEFEVRPNGGEARVTAPLTLTVAADGTLSGSGNGCALGGSIAAADGFHALYRGTLTTTGCTDAHFNGSFPLRLERYGASLLSLQFGVATTALKVEVEAALSTAGTTPPPPPPAPAAGATRYSGTVAWIVEQRTSGGSSAVVSAANLPLALTLDGTTLAGTGTGGGCTFAGQIGAPVAGRITGVATATGCTNAAFNGTYAPVRLHQEDGGALEVEFEKETESAAARVKVTIKGGLVVQGGTSTPPPTPGTGTGTVTAGTWTGDALWVAAQQQNGNLTTLVSVTNPLSLTLAADGGLSGTGFGCTFVGSVTAVVAGLAGSVSASGCTDARFSGSYAGVGIHLENGGAIEVEFERESEQGGGTKLRIEINGLLPAGSGGVIQPPPPPPPATTFALSGTWSSAQAQWADERRVSGVTTISQSAHELTLTIASGGAVSGSGFGCQFSGSLQAVAGSTTAFTGSIIASGCTNADFSTTYASFAAHAEDNNALQVEMERESEGGGVRVKASIDATLARQ